MAKRHEKCVNFKSVKSVKSGCEQHCKYMDYDDEAPAAHLAEPGTLVFTPRKPAGVRSPNFFSYVCFVSFFVFCQYWTGAADANFNNMDWVETWSTVKLWPKRGYN